MTILLQRMREELVRSTYSETTIRSYLHAVEPFRQHVQKRLDDLGPEPESPPTSFKKLVQ